MNDLHSSSFIWKHAVLEFLRGEVMKGGMESGWVDLIQELLKRYRILIDLFSVL